MSLLATAENLRFRLCNDLHYHSEGIRFCENLLFGLNFQGGSTKTNLAKKYLFRHTSSVVLWSQF